MRVYSARPWPGAEAGARQHARRLDHGMPNGAAVAHRAHPARVVGRAVRQLRQVGDLDRHRPRRAALHRGGDVLVHHAQLRIRRRLPRHEAHREADDAEHARRRLAVAAVGLDGPDLQRIRVAASREDRRLGRAHLDRVAERRAGAVRLVACELRRRRARVGHARAHELDLRLAVGRRERGRLAVLLDGAAVHHRLSCRRSPAARLRRCPRRARSRRRERRRCGSGPLATSCPRSPSSSTSTARRSC